MSEAASTAAMTQYETISVIISGLALILSVGVLILMWWGIKAMVDANKDRAERAAEDRKAMQAQAAQAAAQAAEDRAQAAEDRAQAAEDRAQAAEDRAQAAAQAAEDRAQAAAQAAEDRAQAAAQAAEDRAQAAEDRKVTQGLLASLERQGKALERQGSALETLISRTDAVVVELRRFQGPDARRRRP